MKRATGGYQVQQVLSETRDPGVTQGHREVLGILACKVHQVLQDRGAVQGLQGQKEEKDPGVQMALQENQDLKALRVERVMVDQKVNQDL